LVPFFLPNAARASSSTSAELTSEPPPRPKMPATNEAVEITSDTFQGSGPSGWTMAAYSAGILSGLSLASVM
jgi:hypothetical protein